MRQARQILQEMMISSGIWTLLVTVVLAIIGGNKIAMILGSLLGGAAAIFLLWHMFHHLDIALDLEPGQATRHTQVASVQRVAVMAVVLAVSMYFYQYAHPLGTILTLFGVKLSAFAQPTVHKFMEKHRKK
ncbi:MAG: ATP synthase subunit I [Lachnospiraceae bacterium]|nr:ATP synthase subunit I [Lachnospiraceae bacterium]